MQMSIMNTSGVILNTPLVGGAGLSPDAVGGTISNPLPYPANKSGPLAIGATLVIQMHVEDLQNKSVPWLPLTPSTEWQMLIQAGLVTVSFLAVTGTNNLADQAAAVAAV